MRLPGLLSPSLVLLMSALPTAARAGAHDHETFAVPDSVHLLPRIEVVGSRDHAATLPGSASVLDARTLLQSRVVTPNEALRKLPGLAIRDEEGAGLRPNIGIRGLNPTRSTKVTLLEDGVPLAYAPYGDNASYYHPPVERFEQIELLKGAGQMLFGPQTIGGVLNYLTPTPPDRLSGSLRGSVGGLDLRTAHLRLGGRHQALDYAFKRTDGAREHADSRLDDLNFKGLIGRSLTLRASTFRERSHVTYSGLTQAEADRQGLRYNPFKNDVFDIERHGGSLTHLLVLNRSALVTTSAYVSRFSRDWWRQSSTTTDTQGGPGVAIARLAGDRIDADTIASVQGRLRSYTTWGVEPRARLSYRGAGHDGELQLGVKAHVERQERRQVNGTSAAARTGTLAEDNLRRTEAWSVFAVDRMRVGRFGLTPGLRYEHIRTERTNRLPGGASGTDALGTWIPGVGATWQASPAMVVYAGVHAGFAPPRAEDVIASSGTSTEVRPESSTNWELGARLAGGSDSELQATLFLNDFERLTAVGSIAGGSTPLAQGEARFAGAELSGRARHASGLELRGAATWLPVAEQTQPFRQVAGGAVVAGSAAGRRQPYAPEWTLTASAGFRRGGFLAQLEAVHIGSQFADFANTEAPTANGQAGRLGASTVWNATLEQALPRAGASAFVAMKNLADEVHIVDRTRGILVSSPRQFLAGVTLDFTLGR